MANLLIHSDDEYHFQCDLDSLDLLALVTMQEQCLVRSKGYLGPRLLLHQGNSFCDADDADDNWYILMACLTTFEHTFAEHLTAQVDGHRSHCHAMEAVRICCRQNCTMFV